jgi:hypothetical protein
MIMVFLSQSGVVVLWLLTLLYESGVNGHAALAATLEVRHVPFTEKQPVAMLKPLAAVEVAVPVMLRPFTLSPLLKVEVAPALKVKAPVVPSIVKAAVVEVAIAVEVAK